ncbi:hypothetical protein ABPG74_015033 [Tetrahymena malaccensis]
MIDPYYERYCRSQELLLNNLPQEVLKQQEKVSKQFLRRFYIIYRSFLVISFLYASVSLYLGIYIQQLTQYQVESIFMFTGVAFYFLTSLVSFLTPFFSLKTKLQRMACIANYLGGSFIIIDSLVVFIISLIDDCCGVQFEIDSQQVVDMCSTLQNGQICQKIGTQELIERINSKQFIDQVCQEYTCTNNHVVTIKNNFIYWICCINFIIYFLVGALFMHQLLKKIQKVDYEIKKIEKDYVYSKYSSSSSDYQ